MIKALWLIIAVWVEALWCVVTGKAKALAVIKLAAGTHFLSAYGDKRGGKRKAAGTVKAGVKPVESSEGQVVAVKENCPDCGKELGVSLDCTTCDIARLSNGVTL